MNPTMELQAWSAIRMGNATIFTSMVTGNMGMVNKLAVKMANGKQRYLREDLMSEGKVALALAVDEYKEDERSKVRGTRFGTRAYLRIRAAMIEHLRRQAGPVALTKHGSQKLAQAMRDFNEMCQKAGKVPSLQEFAFKYGDDAAELVYANDAMHEPVESVEENLHADFFMDMQSLPPATREVVQAISDGATLGEIAQTWDVPRKELRARLERDCTYLCVS